MHIQAEIKSFANYTANFSLPELALYPFDTSSENLKTVLRNNSFLLQVNTSVYALSIWTGPKRTRTYPYQHVYNTIHHKPRVTLIPFVKDEGKDGERDFLQWDTVSLMTLLGVHVIITYHQTAEKSQRRGAKNREKITNHQLDADYIARRITELASYSSDVLHWNNKEIEQHLPHVVEQAIIHQQQIEEDTGVTLHAIDAIQKRLDNLQHFKDKSRERAKAAQARELSVVHEAESLAIESKAAITITNFYNGEYNFTVDEVAILGDELFLIEKKHIKKGTMPGISDIKDGLLKIMLYCQLERATIDGGEFIPLPVLGLTSNQIHGFCHSTMSDNLIDAFIAKNSRLSKTKQNQLWQLITEARENKFFAYLANGKEERHYRPQIIKDFSNSR